MYPVTQDFLSKMKAVERRVYGKVQIDYTDPFLDQSIQVQASEQANVSYPAQTADAVAVPFAKIASLDGSWVLDGTYALAPATAEEAETHQMGWWGSQLSQADGTFVQPYPTLTVTHFARPIHSLKVVGDSARGEYPVDFRIDLYGPDDTLLYTEQVTGNTEVEWSKTLPSPVLDVVKQVLTITKWSHPGRQAKVLEFFTSVQETYEGDDILLIHLLEEREVSQGSIPVGNISANEIDIRLDNSSRKFDAGNKQSPLYQLLKQNRRIKAWLGVEAENNYTDKPPTFTRSSVAYLSDGTQVAANTPRFEQGRFGKAIMVEEGTTNLFTNPRLLNNGSEWTPVSATAWVDSSGEYPYIHCETQWDGVYQTLSLSATTYTLTYLVKHKAGSNTIGSHFDGPPSLKIRVDRGAWVYGNIITVPSDGNWHLVEIQATYTTAGSYRVFLQPGRGVTEVSEFYFKYAQIEQKPYATSFVDGTRSPETLTIPTAGVLNPQEGTVECWVYVPSFLQPGIPYWRRIWSIRNSGGDGLYALFYYPIDDKFHFRIDSSVSTDIAVTKPSVGWHYFACKWSQAEMALFIDGVKVGSIVNPSLPTSFGDNVISIGARTDGIDYINSLIDDLRISSIARTDEEILAAYQSGQPLPVDEWTTWKETFNGSIYPVERVWVPLGTFWSGDWSAPEDGVYAQTTGRDRLELLRKSTYSTSQVQQNTTLYDLAVAVLQDAGLKPEEYWVDPELQQYTVPYAYFEPQSHREALRKIAEACLGQVYCDRNGIVRVEGPSYLASKTEAELEITADDYFRKDNPVKWSEIANYIEVETQPLRPVDTPQEVYRSNEPVSIQAGQTVTITAYYNETPCIDAVASLENATTGCVIQEATYYAWGADVKVYSTTAGTFTLVINARPLKVLNKERAIAKDDASITDNGLIKYTFPANLLVQTREVAQDMANKLLAYYKDPRRDVEVEWRGNPALLLGDRVSVVDSVETNDYYVIRQEIEYDGALRAKLSGRRAT
jgi:hypothetical protein